MGAFLGGAATGLVERIEDDERKAEKKADRAYTKSEETRLYKRNIRDKKNETTKELAGLLSTLYKEPANVERIMAAGNTAGAFWAEWAPKALELGYPPDDMFKTVTTSSGDAGNVSQSIANETISGLEIPVIENISGSSNVAPEGLGGSTPTDNTQVQLSSGFSVNPVAWANMFGSVKDDGLSSDNARLTVMSNQLARNPEHKDKERFALERELILKNIKDKAEAQRDATGEDVEPFTLGTITSNVDRAMRSALLEQKFDVGIDNQIRNAEEGDRWKQGLAELDAAKELTTFNTVFKSDGMDAAIKGIHDGAINSLEQYGWELYTKSKDEMLTVEGGRTVKNPDFGKTKVAASIEEFEKTASSRGYSSGDVIRVTKGSGFVLVMYTGIPNIYDNNNLYIGLTRAAETDGDM